MHITVRNALSTASTTPQTPQRASQLRTQHLRWTARLHGRLVHRRMVDGLADGTISWQGLKHASDLVEQRHLLTDAQALSIPSANRIANCLN